MRDKEEESGDKFFFFGPFSSYLRFLPLVLGIMGVMLLGVGIFLSLGKKEEPAITIRETLKNKEKEKIFVDVEGAVINPGVYEIAYDGRVRDALAAAYGLSSEADREWVERNLNLAAKLVDGAKIYIPKVGEILGENQRSNINDQKLGEKININIASFSELEGLPGVGAVSAQKIIDGRPYMRIEELVERKIVNKGVWEKIKEKISVF